jgi:hypothetical protein
MACLAHTVPGVSLQLALHSGERLLVSRSQVTADMDPCQLRATLIAAGRPGWPRLHEEVAGIEVVRGVHELGGGLYQPTHPAERHARWFLTLLDAQVVQQAAARCPVGLDHDDLEVSIRPDSELAVCAVRCADRGGGRDRLDEVATWLLSACLADELVASIGDEVRP